MSKLVLLILVFVTVNGLNVRPKPPRQVFQSQTFGHMNSLEEKLVEIHSKIRKVWDKMADNLKLAEITLKKIQAMEDYAHQLQEEYDPGEFHGNIRTNCIFFTSSGCPHPEGKVDYKRGVCYVYRSIEQYGRNWDDARQYCLAYPGGDLAEPHIADLTVQETLNELFGEELEGVEADLHIGIRAKYVSKLVRSENNGSLARSGGTYDYFYINLGYEVDDDDYFEDGEAKALSTNFVAALRLPLRNDKLTVTNRLASEERGFLCEFKLQPYVPSFKGVPKDHIDDTVVFASHEIPDNEAPPSTTTQAPSTTTTIPPDSGLTDFQDECDPICEDDEICYAETQQCIPLSACDPFCSPNQFCSDSNHCEGIYS